MSKSSNLLKGLGLNKEEEINAKEEKNVEDAMEEVSGKVLSSITFEEEGDNSNTLLPQDKINEIKEEKKKSTTRKSAAKKDAKEEVKIEKEVTLTDHRKNTGGAPGLTPTKDGEPFNIKRTYQFRESTLRKLSILKANHPDINVYLNTIIDDAINEYYDKKMKH